MGAHSCRRWILHWILGAALRILNIHRSVWLVARALLRPDYESATIVRWPSIAGRAVCAAEGAITSCGTWNSEPPAADVVEGANEAARRGYESHLLQLLAQGERRKGTHIESESFTLPELSCPGPPFLFPS